ncbi:GNAT family N-acetyltransferase [Halorubrum sp. SS7]|uniref:GNAT family N-acetyltransferase n=3 Tax=unclassified Halorubrum TaxID=2642239 RepID=UPI001F5456FF|nr:GNAT family N-acetyltransferase [Halorubrum sp. SS7]
MEPNELSLRSYDTRDDAAIWALHEWAMRETGVNPADIPGTADLRTVETSYLETGGTFVVATVDGEQSYIDQSTETEQSGYTLSDLTTYDGLLVAMGGILPNQAGHSDERDRPGAAELHRMRVAPPQQRRGYGKQILRELERRAAANGFETLLATTSTRQSAALDFYAGQGYEQTGTSTAGSYELVHFEKQL